MRRGDRRGGFRGNGACLIDVDGDGRASLVMIGERRIGRPNVSEHRGRRL